jgi:Fe2+ or Zn2+ uptake regulation protein
MLNSLITSQTRIRLLKKFFLNSNTTAHLRGLEAEFGESSNGIRIELNRFEEAGLLTSVVNGNKKLYRANTQHPLFGDIHNIILKETGLDKVIENIIHRLGDLVSIYLTGDFAHGMDSAVIELVLVGNNIDEAYLSAKTDQAEKLAGRRIICSVIDPVTADDELKKYNPCDLLPLWSNKVQTIENIY